MSKWMELLDEATKTKLAIGMGPDGFVLSAESPLATIAATLIVITFIAAVVVVAIAWMRRTAGGGR